MSFLQLIRREMQGSLPRLAVMSGLSGFGNAAILTAINSGAEAASSGEVSLSSAELYFSLSRLSSLSKLSITP